MNPNNRPMVITKVTIIGETEESFALSRTIPLERQDRYRDNMPLLPSFLETHLQEGIKSDRLVLCGATAGKTIMNPRGEESLEW